MQSYGFFADYSIFFVTLAAPKLLSFGSTQKNFVSSLYCSRFFVTLHKTRRYLDQRAAKYIQEQSKSAI